MATGTDVEIEVYGRLRDGITSGTLEELTFAYAEALGAPELNPEPQRPAGYEETGFVSHDVPGVGVSVFSSPAPGHSYERFEDSMKPVGHQGFLMDAKIMSGVLFHFLTDEELRSAVQEGSGHRRGAAPVWPLEAQLHRFGDLPPTRIAEIRRMFQRDLFGRELRHERHGATP